MTDIEADLQEIQEVLNVLKSPRLISLMKNHEATLKKQLAKEQAVKETAKGAVKETVEEVPAGIVPAVTEVPTVVPIKRWTPITKFAWDQDSKCVSVYVSLEGVGDIKDNVSCDFSSNAFDLQVTNYNGGTNLRLLKDNLDKDISVDQCKYTVKRDRIVLSLRKVKGEYGVDQWVNLTAKKSKTASSKKEDPTAGIMDMMKDMYDSGDDTMKKAIGEAMLKSREEKNNSFK